MWQIRHRAGSLAALGSYVELPPDISEGIARHGDEYQFSLTPYLLKTLVNSDGTIDLDDPFTYLFFPPFEPFNVRADVYEATKKINWEMESEICVPGSQLWQWKYTDRICYRSKGCMSICTYCFQAHRTVDRNTIRTAVKGDWELGMDWLREHPQIREFLFSGGDPLMQTDDRLEEMLADVRSIPHIETIRFNSAFFMHSPMRITPRLVELFKRYNVTEIGVHVVHPRQFTEEAIESIHRLDETGVLRLVQIPLMRGVNDNLETLKKLLEISEQHKLKGYYLTHGMPWTISADRFRTPVHTGVKLLSALKRHLSNVAFPEYVIVARGGKMQVPLERSTLYINREDIENALVWTLEDTQIQLTTVLQDALVPGDSGFYKVQGTPEFIYTTYKEIPIVVFKGWKGWEVYMDDLDSD